MKFFKSIELFLQLVLLLMTTIAFVINDYEVLNPIIFILAIALLQVISLVINQAAGSQFWKKKIWRKYHLIGIVVVILLIIVASIESSSARNGDKDDKYSMAGLETIIYATIPAILLCLFYVFITFAEWKNLKKG
jgi:glucose-6-phosphate-specific signal transduction histidine kinase